MSVKSTHKMTDKTGKGSDQRNIAEFGDYLEEDGDPPIMVAIDSEGQALLIRVGAVFTKDHVDGAPTPAIWVSYQEKHTLTGNDFTR